MGEFGDPSFFHPDMSVINFGKPSNNDKRFVVTLWKSPVLPLGGGERTGPRAEGGTLLSDREVSAIKAKVGEDIAQCLAQNQIPWGSGGSRLKLGEDGDQRPGDLYISRLMLIKGGTRRQANHTDCPGLPPSGPQPGGSPLPPCTVLYPLQSNGFRLLFVEDETAAQRKPMCRLLHSGQAFLFAGWKVHAGTVLPPDNNVRLRVELDVFGSAWNHNELGP